MFSKKPQTRQIHSKAAHLGQTPRHSRPLTASSGYKDDNRSSPRSGKSLLSKPGTNGVHANYDNGQPRLSQSHGNVSHLTTIDQSANDPIVWYNVYRVYFTQTNKPDHEAIALVRVNATDQGRGKFFHVTGDLGLGMDFQIRSSYNFSASRSYREKTRIGYITGANVAALEALMRNVRPPHDERVLFQSRAQLQSQFGPLRDCHAWVSEVIAAARGQGLVVTSMS